MQQNMTLNNTPQEEDKIVDVVQGGTIPFGVKLTPYFYYQFLARNISDINFNGKKNFRDFFRITHDIIEHFSKDRVIRFECMYSTKTRHRKPIFKEWIGPEYIEDGSVNEFKKYLIESNRKDLIWADCERYVAEKMDEWLFPREIRSYTRDVCVMQEHFDWDLITKAEFYAHEDRMRGADVYIYPHSKIVHKSTDEETIRSYMWNNDAVMEISYSAHLCSGITIKPYTKHITYEQLLEEIKPIFEKYGWKYGNTVNPYFEVFECNVHCHDCDSPCHFNINPKFYLKEHRANAKRFEK